MIRPVEPLTCIRCGAAREIADNFCRKCGHQLTVTVPAVQPAASALPSIPVAIPPSVVRGVAVLALSTGIEWAMRRVAGNAARAAGRALVPGSSQPSRQARDASPREVSVDEIVYVRKVQLRR